MITYAFRCNNGNNELIEVYQTIDEAVSAARAKWDHLSKKDKLRYSDYSQGAYFWVTEMDGEEFGLCIKDFAYEVDFDYEVDSVYELEFDCEIE